MPLRDAAVCTCGYPTRYAVQTPIATPPQMSSLRYPARRMLGAKATQATNPAALESVAMSAPQSANANRDQVSGRCSSARVQHATPNAVAMNAIWKGANQSCAWEKEKSSKDIGATRISVARSDLSVSRAQEKISAADATPTPRSKVIMIWRFQLVSWMSARSTSPGITMRGENQCSAQISLRLSVP